MMGVGWSSKSSKGRKLGEGKIHLITANACLRHPGVCRGKEPPALLIHKNTFYGNTHNYGFDNKKH